MNYNLLIFAYSFPHTKTKDFLQICYELKLKPIVIAAPFKKLKTINKNKKINFPDVLDAKTLCKKYKFKYYKIEHSDYKKIYSIITKNKINIGLISGARILNKNIIKLFKFGIINYHPGKLPENRGLNTFYNSIKNNIRPAVTVHFIDENIDLGKMIFLKYIQVYKNDNFKRIKKRIYINEIYLHKLICKKILNNKKINSKKFTFKKTIKNNIELPNININEKFKAWKKIFI